MSICAGTPISAPKGFLNLAAGATYYFLRSSAATRIVTLLELICRPPRKATDAKAVKVGRSAVQLPLPSLIRMPRSDWERGLWDNKIIPGERRDMPPWLEELEGLDLVAIDAERTHAAKSHQQRIDEKLFTFHALLPRIEEILDDEDAEKIINRHARQLSPAQNETRVRLWLFIYIAFGRNRQALHYPIHQIGRWDRMASTKTAKRGAPSKKGSEHGHNTTPAMLQKIVDSYPRHAGIGISNEQVYQAAMRDDFGCRARWGTAQRSKQMEIYHPRGEAFPTMGTYFYHVNKRFRPRLVRETRLGRNRARSDIKQFLGTFTESAWNLMQRVEADGYRVADLPKGYIEGSDLPCLVVVTKRDTASGRKTGIGFSQGGETAAAYRMATFCEAIGLQAFARLVGLVVEVSGKGASPHDITDRGPGATTGGLARNSDLLPVIRESAQAYSGQAKALIETSNPKISSDAEAPAFRRSNMTVVELARRELFKLLEYNETTCVANRVDPELEHKVTRLSPNGIWDALDSVGRNDAIQVGFDQAVRAYLDLVPAVLRRGGIEVAGRNYY